MNKHTYGISQAAVNLVDMINHHPRHFTIQRKVGRLIENFFELTNELELMQNRSAVVKLYNLALEDVEQNQMQFLDGNDSLEMKIQTHIMNVLRGRYKSWMRGERANKTRVDIINDDFLLFRSADGRMTLGIDVLKSIKKGV